MSVPKNCDVFITTDKKQKAEKIHQKFVEEGKDNWNKVTIITIPNRGRDVSALLVGTAPYIMNYDYVCFAHDKKVAQLDQGIKGYYFSEHCFENILGSKEYVENIIAKFDSEPFLGLLCPPPPHHSDYFVCFGCEWGYNYEITKKLYDELELKSPITKYKEPIAPFGTMFWFRTKAMKKLFDKKWKFNDFPREPNNVDGTILHAVERIYPFVVQDAGYFTAWCVTDDYAQTEINNLHYMLRNINSNLFTLYGVQNYNCMIGRLQYEICNSRQNRGMPNPDENQPPPALTSNSGVPIPAQYNNGVQPLTGRRYRYKQKMKKIIPKPIWEFMKKVYHKFGGKKWVG